MEIIDYQATPDRKWLLLQGIAQGKQGIDGVLSLYSVSEKRHIYEPPLNAHGGCFASITLGDKNEPSNLFAYTHKADESQTVKVKMVEIGVSTAILKFLSLVCNCVRSK